MYCVKCGVKLAEGVEKCPLCQTPVWNPEGLVREKNYPDEMPGQFRESARPAAMVMTVLCVIALAVMLIVCFQLYGELRWGGYAIFGTLLFYVLAVLPLWFCKAWPEIFVPVDHLFTALYVLYICRKTGGHWFVSFALPVIGACCLLLLGVICLLKYTKGGRIFILGGFLILLGGYTMLVEFFEHISFGVEMFRWSPYSTAVFGLAGLFLIIAGCIPSLREVIRKRFFF